MFLKKLVKKLIYGPFEPGIHYSQSGEDLNVFAIIKSIILLNNGFFIDVGHTIHSMVPTPIFYIEMAGKELI
jgi:hypothetical protein